MQTIQRGAVFHYAHSPRTCSTLHTPPTPQSVSALQLAPLSAQLIISHKMLLKAVCWHALLLHNSPTVTSLILNVFSTAVETNTETMLPLDVFINAVQATSLIIPLGGVSSSVQQVILLSLSTAPVLATVLQTSMLILWQNYAKHCATLKLIYFQIIQLGLAKLTALAYLISMRIASLNCAHYLAQVDCLQTLTPGPVSLPKTAPTIPWLDNLFLVDVLPSVL